MNITTMNIKEWKADRIKFISDFVDDWTERNGMDEKTFPLDMNGQIWDEALEFFMKTSITNGEKVSTDDVEVLDISEDFSGRDPLTYEYEGKTYISY